MIFVRKMLVGLALLLLSGQLMALESDRKQALEVNADSTEGTLGDGMAVLSGNVVIRQGSMLVMADIAEIEKILHSALRVKIEVIKVDYQQLIKKVFPSASRKPKRLVIK